jgi:hypothetical protein
MDDQFIKSHSDQSKRSFGRKLAWWIFGPFLGTMAGSLLGAVIWLIIFFLFSGEGALGFRLLDGL